MTASEPAQQSNAMSSPSGQPLHTARESDAPAGSGQTQNLFIGSRIDPANLEPAPIRPEWILDGQPEAKAARLATGTPGWATVDHWSCTSGVFKWHYGWNETVLFLEGDVEITDQNGVVYHGKPGVTLMFPAGTTAVWRVPNYIRKIAFNQKQVPWLLRKTVRVFEKLRLIS